MSDKEERQCSDCEETNLVAKSFNCTNCRTWNKFEEVEEEPVKKNKKQGEKKKWLN